MSNAGNIRSQLSPSNLVNKGRALLDQVRQLWQEKLILPNGDINGKKMSWCLVVTSATFCLILMLITIAIGLSRTQNSICSRHSLTGAHKEKCPHKRGFLEGKPPWGSCGGKNGCHTETSASCRTKCFDNPSCKAWTFNSRQKHCLLRRGGSVSTSASYNSVWGLPCRATDCQDMSTHKSWHYNGQWWFTRIVQASEFYVGTTSTTRSGKTCRNWSKVRGHVHVGDHNHCRNPNSQWEGVGCYTEDGGNELCNVPKCRTNTLANPIWQ